MSKSNLASRPSAVEQWAALIEQTAQGDEASLAALYDGTSAQVHGLVLRIVRDPAIAEEVTEDVYLQVWRQAVQYDAARGGPISWLLTVARSRAIDRVRSRRTELERSAPISEAMTHASEEPGPEELSQLGQRSRLVRAALTSLGPDQRVVLELAYFRGMSHSEIAAHLDEPLGTVKTRIRLAMARTRQLLAPALGESP